MGNKEFNRILSKCLLFNVVIKAEEIITGESPIKDTMYRLKSSVTRFRAFPPNVEVSLQLNEKKTGEKI